MKFSLILSLLSFFFFFNNLNAQSPDGGSFDPDYTKESVPSSPEVGSLGRYGDITGSPYTGKIGLSIPLHSISLEGLQIPIALSYDSGGIRVAQESSWVGMNWSLSGKAAITRTIQGNDDLNENVIPNSVGDISARVYSDIDVIVPTNGDKPYIPLTQIEEIHSSYGLGGAATPARLHADTQPDIYEVSLFGKSYKFRLNKRQNAEDDTLTTHIFDNEFATITYDITTRSFTVVDDRGFTFDFTTKDYSASMNSSRSSTPANAVSETKEHTLDGILDDRDQKANTVITSWLLNSITSPKGKTISFGYQEGAHFTFPSFSGAIYFKEGYTNNSPYNQYDESAKKFTSSMSIIHSNYLTNITGDFGEISFNSFEDRRDLATGKDMENIYPSSFSGATFKFYTKTSTINTMDNNHGTPSANFYSLQARRLQSIDVKDYNGIIVKTIDFDNDSYYNASNHLNTPDEARYLRLKLDGVTVQNKNYAFNYISPNTLPDKETFDTDFWGFYNGATNATNIPSIGRFGTSDVNQPQRHPVNPRQTLGQVFFNLEASDLSANFQFGNMGNLNKVIYPTGGYTEFEYEGNNALISAPPPYVVTETYINNVLRWTSLIDEDNYNFTYLYLKYAQDPTYNFYDHVYVPGSNTSSTPIAINQTLNVQAPAVITGQGGLELFYPNDNQQNVADIPKYYVQDLESPSLVYPLFYFRDWFDSVSGDTNPPLGYSNVIIPPGAYKLKRELTIIDAPGVRLNPEDFGLAESSVSEALELFPIGGSRIKSITTKNNDHSFVSKKLYNYALPNFEAGTSSSGKLMNDLVYHTKFSGYHSYTPTNSYQTNIEGVRISSSSSLGSNPSANGSHIGYSFVSESYLDKDDIALSRIDRTYSNQSNDYFKETFDVFWDYNLAGGDPDYIEKVSAKNVPILGMAPKMTYEYSNGNLITESIYDCSNTLKKQLTNSYENAYIQPDLNYYANFMGTPWILDFNDNIPPWFTDHETYITYQLPVSYARKSLLMNSETVDYLNDGLQTYSEQYNTYDDKQNLIKSFGVVNGGEVTTTKYFYPYSSSTFNDPGMVNLRNDNFFNQIVKSQSYLNDTKLGSSRLIFENNSNTAFNTLVTSSQASKGANSLEPIKRFEKYDPDGHLLQSRQEDGTPTSYIWGYNNQYIIAKIDNAVYSDVAPYVSNLKIKSDTDTTSCLNNGGCNEQTLRNALNALRSNLPNTMITTYTYDPLIGLTSVTDSRGYAQFFEYDAYNRLLAIYDDENNLLSKNEYNSTQEILNVLGQDAIGIIECGSVVPDPTIPPTGPGGISVEDFNGDSTTNSRVTSTTIEKEEVSYPLLRNSIDLIDTQTTTNNVTLDYKAFPYGGSGNYEYRWKVSNGSFTPYSNSPSWSYVYDCSSQLTPGIEVVCEIRDKNLEVTKRSRVRHLVLCNN